MWILLQCFHRIYACRKDIVRLTNLFYLNDYKKMAKQYISISKINIAEEASLEFRLRKIAETRNYLLEEILNIMM